jgi:signal transduction histidine kinase
MAGTVLDEQRLRRLIEAGRALISHLKPETLLNELLEVAREVTGARYAALGVLDEHREELEQFITAGIDPETHRLIGDLPRGRGILGLLIEDPRPLRLDHIGHHPRSYGFPSGHPEMNTFLGVPIVIRGEAFGNLYLTEKAGGEPFTDADEEAVVILADWAAIAIENAKLYESVDKRRDHLERAVRGLDTTLAIAQALGGETDLNRILELIVKRGRALVGARTLVILLAQDDDLVVAAGAGEVPAGVHGQRMPVEGTVAGEVLRSKRSERHDDASATMGPSIELLGLDADNALLVPLAFRGRPVGVLTAFDRLDGEAGFDREDERLLVAFAASAATAVATGKNVEEQRLRQSIEASEQERRRWARELHDETLQSLAGLRVLLSSALRGGEKELRGAVATAVENVTDEIANLRTLIVELRPAALDEYGAAAAIQSLAERTATREGLDVVANVDLAWERGEESTRHSPELESTMYRVVQESMTNAIKHAGARRVRVDVIERDGCVEIAVSDDGQGFDPAGRTEGFGLKGMAERVELADGELEIDSGPSGTTVRARLPAQRRPSSQPVPQSG